MNAHRIIFPTVKTLNERKICVFDRNRPISRKWYEIGPHKPLTGSHKSYSVSRSVTLSDLKRRGARGPISGGSSPDIFVTCMLTCDLLAVAGLVLVSLSTAVSGKGVF